MKMLGSAILNPPPWVRRLMPPDGTEREIHQSSSDVDFVIQRHRSPGVVLISATAPNATSLSSSAFGQMTCEAYTAILALVPKECHPARFWNYIPDIHAAMDDGLDRYMVFNLGRRCALSDRYGSEHAIARCAPTATGVGHNSSELVIHCLALRDQPEHIENPRQVSAYQYSDLYGPASPSFSRATLVNLPGGHGRSLIVGGTSSVRGEGTIAPFDVWSQFDETRTNLDALLKRAFGGEADLGCFESVRAYYARVGDETSIRAALQETFPRAADIELVQAEICRQSLLIEIEGVARPPGNWA